MDVNQESLKMHYDLEGKCALFKEFGGINLEDIAAPRCFEIERRLKELCDIPVFHDDQRGAGAAGIAIGKLLIRMALEILSCAISMVSSVKVITASPPSRRRYPI